MTKKHFEALAAAMQMGKPMIHGERGETGWTLETGRLQQWERDVFALGDVCARFNPNFDRARFLAACGVEE
jgi:hypothetical protein